MIASSDFYWIGVRSLISSPRLFPPELRQLMPAAFFSLFSFPLRHCSNRTKQRDKKTETCAKRKASERTPELNWQAASRSASLSLKSLARAKVEDEENDRAERGERCITERKRLSLHREAHVPYLRINNWIDIHEDRQDMIEYRIPGSFLGIHVASCDRMCFHWGFR